MAYTFKDPISIIPDDLGLVRTAKMIRDTREYNRFDTDNLYSMLNTATVAPGDEWIINSLYDEVNKNLGDVVSSGKYFGATNAVAKSVSALKNSKGLKLASQSYAAYEESKKMEDQLNAQYGSSLNFSEKKWQTHSSYYQDENGKWVDNVFDYDVQRELDYNAEMIQLIGNINADSGGVSFAKYKVNPGDIRDFMIDSKGISKEKAKRVALALADAYLNGATGQQDYRKLTELDTNLNTNMQFTHDEAIGDISQRLIDIASRQVYWDSNATPLAANKPAGGGGGSGAGQGSWTPVQGSAINGGLGWEGIEDLHTKKIDAVKQMFGTPTSDADLNSRSAAQNTLNALRNQEVLIVNNYADEATQNAYNEMSNAFSGNENLKDLLQGLTLNTSSSMIVEIPYDRIDKNILSTEVNRFKGQTSTLTWGLKEQTYNNVRHWAEPQKNELAQLISQLIGKDGQDEQSSLHKLNATLGTDYTMSDRPALKKLISNYFKYQVSHGDKVDELMESRGTEITTQLTGYAVNTLTDQNNTLSNINEMLSQVTLNQFTIDGVVTGSPKYNDILVELQNASGDMNQQVKFKQITQPGISTGTPSRFMLELSNGANYTLTENYGLEREFMGGFTYSVLNSMSEQNPLIMAQEASAKTVQRKIADGTYKMTGDGNIRVKDYVDVIQPLLKLEIQNNFQQEVYNTQGYYPDVTQFNEKEKQAYLNYENTQLTRYREKVLSKIMWAAHMQLVASGSNQVPAEYLTLSYEQLLQIAQSDYNYSLLLQTYGADLSSSLIVNLR